MAENEYVFIDKWKVEADLREVADIIEDSEGLVRWWPSVYLEYRQLHPGDQRGVGRIVQYRAKGFLPYTLRITFGTIESRYPNGLTLNASGDLEGVGIWSFAQNGPYVDVTYDWKVKANKPVVKLFSFALKPIFAANHRWTMARGEESLKLELARRRAGTNDEKTRIPEPRGPVFPHNLRLLRTGSEKASTRA
jgi:hypothetical protein